MKSKAKTKNKKTIKKKKKPQWTASALAKLLKEHEELLILVYCTYPGASAKTRCAFYSDRENATMNYTIGTPSIAPNISCFVNKNGMKPIELFKAMLKYDSQLKYDSRSYTYKVFAGMELAPVFPK